MRNPSRSQPEIILGKPSLLETIDKCQEILESNSARTLMFVRFHDPTDLPRTYVSDISTREKARAAESIGIKTVVIEIPCWLEPDVAAELVRNSCDSPNVTAVVIQRPLPVRFESMLATLPPSKDIDGCIRGAFTVCTTAEAAGRIIMSFVNKEQPVAVVGGRGFVGNGVVTYLQRAGYQNVNTVDLEDNLNSLLNADAIVSAVGQANLITEKHLSDNNEIVIDCGFSIEVGDHIQIRGDVDPRAYERVRRIVPVPGGMGPFQMATLLERFMLLSGLEISPWRLGNRN